MRYRVNSPQVISETLGGETVIVNLQTGNYFSLQATAVDVWQGIEDGRGTGEIVGLLAAGYDAPAAEIEQAVVQLLDELAAAELLVAEEGDDPPAAAPAAAEGERRPFVAPSFSAYTDMQDIILLDPVHEVDPQGWPHTSAGA